MTFDHCPKTNLFCPKTNLFCPKTILLALAIALVATLSAGTAGSHEIRPALLEITEREPGWFDVTWKVPALGDRVLGLQPVFPPSFTLVGPPSNHLVPGALIQYSKYRSDGEPLVGESVFIRGLDALQIDVLLRIQLLSGDTHSTILRPSSPSFLIPERETRWRVIQSYWRMGVTHILEGVDHLLFLFALMLLVTGTWKLFKTVTAFTLAHSITLALAALGVVHVQSAPTEAIISLSIVFLAAEVLRKLSGGTGLTERYPWGVAFVFGLFHGLGFAGALSQIGLPAHEVPLALLFFNVGVETGQILFLAGVLIVLWGLNRLRLPMPPRFERLMPYAIGSIAAFWTIERVVSMFQRSVT